MRDEEQAEQLDRLWAAYREATPELETSVNFMPQLWAKIDAARPVSWALPLARLASRLLPLAAAVTLAMSFYIWTPLSGGNSGVSGYVDVLVADLLDEQQPALSLAGVEEI